ncbi:unnamed protein product [Arctogadus glacialis]
MNLSTKLTQAVGAKRRQRWSQGSWIVALSSSTAMGFICAVIRTTRLSPPPVPERVGYTTLWIKTTEKKKLMS